MPENSDNKLVFSLSEVAQSIQKTISNRYTSVYWIKAEMNKLNYYQHSGHCYPELIEKKEGKIIAQFKSTLWKDDYENINNRFLQILKEPLKDGIKILFSARITFDAVYGLSLRIIDIDPAYTLGDLEKEKQETIKRLKSEMLFDKNKHLKMAILPQRIAVISVETSKGYADFVNVLGKNAWGYKFFHILFPSLLQGEKAIESIIAQLDRIRKVADHFDAVAIIRGGGGDVGLSCYNSYELARTVAQFPLPVLTGIGHATNETVAEMIAFYNAITPTKLAEFFIQKFHNISVPLSNAIQIISLKSNYFIREQKKTYLNMSKYFSSVAVNLIISNKTSLKQNLKSINQFTGIILKQQQKNLMQYAFKMNLATKNNLITQKNLSGFILKRLFKAEAYNRQIHLAKLLSIEKQVAALNPVNVIRRGYSITYVNNKLLKKHTSVNKDDILKTILFDGVVTSKVLSTHKNKQDDTKN